VQQSQVKPLQGLSANYLIWQSLIKNLYKKTTACFEDEDEAPCIWTDWKTSHTSVQRTSITGNAIVFTVMSFFL